MVCMIWYIQSCFKFSKPGWYLWRPIIFIYIKIIVFACTKPLYWYKLFHCEVEAAIGTNQWHWLDCTRPWLPWWVGFPFWLFRFAWVLTVSIYSKKCTTAQVGGRGFIPRRTKTLEKVSGETLNSYNLLKTMHLMNVGDRIGGFPVASTEFQSCLFRKPNDSSFSYWQLVAETRSSFSDITCSKKKLGCAFHCS